ncbi:hypothetical protein TGP89_243302 [Toxoplasma gondii p89]|uniref:Uncharacterized protein n=1 Tax=Toxoplasma gondii p89 TaxID=943119 RepID=A0A086JQ12_TOXGO|nr:hypothetical protein TGP89_243302 [Toxoplasma gondii p89]
MYKHFLAPCFSAQLSPIHCASAWSIAFSKLVTSVAAQHDASAHGLVATARDRLPNHVWFSSQQYKRHGRRVRL